MQDKIKILETLIKSRAVDHHEIFLQERKLLQTESREEKVFSLEEASEQGVAVRVFRKGRCGFAHGNELNETGFKRLVELAMQNLEAVDEELAPALVQRAEAKYAAPFDDQLGWRTQGEKFALAQTLEREARQMDRRVIRVRGARYEEVVGRVMLKNSRGFVGEYRNSICEVSLMAVAEENGKQESGWESDFSPYFAKLSAREVGRRAAEHAVSLLGARSISTQSCPALLDPVVGASLLGVLAASFMADQVRKERSVLGHKLGQKIYSPLVTLIDDPMYPGGFVQTPFDAEGTTAYKTEVVSAGQLKGFLYDLQTAQQMKGQSTGNATRTNYKEPPRVGVTNFFIVPGQKNLNNLLQQMGQGFWIADLIGVHTADPVTGDFSLGATGYWVEGGKRKFPVRGVAVSGNLHEIFNRVSEVGAGLRFYNNYGCPPLLISSIEVGGA